jgi:hypothetical protein
MRQIGEEALRARIVVVGAARQLRDATRQARYGLLGQIHAAAQHRRVHDHALLRERLERRIR